MLLVSDIVRAAVRFGGPDRQPRVACIAPMGKEFGIALRRDERPLVDRFDIFGNPRGTSLHLPSRGRTDRALRPGRTVDAAFLTYLDRGEPPVASGHALLRAYRLPAAIVVRAGRGTTAASAREE